MLPLSDLPWFIAASGCGLLLLAGRQERLGRLAAARRFARTGGFVAAAGIAAQIVWMLSPPWSGKHLTPVFLLGLGAALLCGSTALLAGLSGKPRPSGGVAALLLVLALLLRLGC